MGFLLRWRPVKNMIIRNIKKRPAGPDEQERKTGKTYIWGEVKNPLGVVKQAMLELPEGMISPDTHSRFRLPEAHKLILRVGEVRHEMQPGDILVLDGGTVEYRELRTWMGYLVFYDWTIPWLLAACVLAIGSLGWHFWGKFAAKPWMRPEADDRGSAEKTDNKEKQVP